MKNKCAIRIYDQCTSCANWLFFKPLPDSTFSCCEKYGETVENIDLKSEVSPAVQRHNIDGQPCSFYIPGLSKFEPSSKNPFDIHPERAEGEKRLKERLNLP